jgi:archaellum component FlaG (FlaF/FlaG flagellin family)
MHSRLDFLQLKPRFRASVFFRTSLACICHIVQLLPLWTVIIKMKKLITTSLALSLIALGVSSLHANASGPAPESADVGREARTVAAYTAIEVSGPYKVLINASGATRALELSGWRKDMADLETYVEKDTLHIRPRSRNSFTFRFGKGHDPVTINITTSGLKSLSMSGSGDVELSRFEGTELKLESSGPGDLIASGVARDLTVRASGSGDMDLHRLRANNLNLVMSGPGDVAASGISQDLNAVVTGPGDLTVDDVHAAKVNAMMRGPGSVSLSGSSREIRAEIAGSGDLEACSLAVETVSAMLNGPGSACVSGAIKRFDAEVHGSGDLEARGLQAQNARVIMSSAGNISLSGSSATLSADVSGSGDLDAKGLQVARAVTRSNGPGNIYLQKVSETLDAEVRGSGDVNAETECKDVKVTMSGPGGVHLRGKAASLNAQLSGSGNLDARDMLTAKADVQVRGPGNAVVNVKGKVDAQGRQIVTDKEKVVWIDRSGTREERN